MLMSRKQIGLRMKDETRDQLERVRGGLSRTDYIEGAVLAQIARDLKDEPTRYTLSSFDPESQRQILAQISGELEAKQEKRVAIASLGIDIIEDERMPPNMAITVPSGEVFVGGKKIDNSPIEPVARNLSQEAYSIRPSAESKAGVLPVPKKAQKGRK